MTRDYIGPINNSPSLKFVGAKVAQAAQSQKTHFQSSSIHTHTYGWWIETYRGVPYFKTQQQGESINPVKRCILFSLRSSPRISKGCLSPSYPFELPPSIGQHIALQD